MLTPRDFRTQLEDLAGAQLFDRRVVIHLMCFAPTIIDYRGKTPEKSAEGVRLVTAKVVKAGFVNDEPAEFIPAENYDRWMTRGLPRQWDVVITTEAPMGEVAFLKDDEACSVRPATDPSSGPTPVFSIKVLGLRATKPDGAGSHRRAVKRNDCGRN